MERDYIVKGDTSCVKDRSFRSSVNVVKDLTRS